MRSGVVFWITLSSLFVLGLGFGGIYWHDQGMHKRCAYLRRELADVDAQIKERSFKRLAMDVAGFSIEPGKGPRLSRQQQASRRALDDEIAALQGQQAALVEEYHACASRCLLWQVADALPQASKP